MAWAKRFTTRCAPTFPITPAASMRRSAAIAIFWPISCGGCSRTVRTHRSSRSPPIRRCRSTTFCARRGSKSASPRPRVTRKFVLPIDLYAPSRLNSAGIEFGHRKELDALVEKVRAAASAPAKAAPLLDGIDIGGVARPVLSPIDGKTIGEVIEGDAAIATSAMEAAQAGFAAWNATPLADRAACLERAGDLIEQRQARLIALLQARRRQDARRCRRRNCARRWIIAAITRRSARATLAPQAMPGPTGESNELRYRGRGVFVCISPWNFPLAIFLGQVTRRACGRQCGGCQARRADAADRVRSHPHTARGRYAGECASCSYRATARSGARWSPIAHCRGRGLYRIDRGRPPDQPRARGQETARSCR